VSVNEAGDVEHVQFGTTHDHDPKAEGGAPYTAP
jgi:hypothetical protein